MSLDDLFDRAIDFAGELIRIPGDPGDEGRVAARVLQELDSLGFEDIGSDEVGNVFGRIPGRGDAPAVMLSSHLDVVDIGEADAWEYPPRGGLVVDGWLHGRGAMDIKGPLALQTCAAASMRDEPPQGDIIVAHTVLEERGGWGMEHLVRSGRFEPGVVIIGESTRGDICIGHRGRAELLIELHGLAGHASAPDRARNPLYATGRVLDALREFTGLLPSDPVLGPSTLAPTEVTTLPASRNVIPDLVRIVVDWRVLPGSSPAGACEQLESHLAGTLVPDGISVSVRTATERQRTHTGVEEDRRLFTPGFLLDPEHPVVLAAAAAAGGDGAAADVRPWTFATDGGHTCGEAGIPTVGYAPGEERFAHTNRERLELSAARDVFHRYPAVIRAVQDASH